MCETNVDDCASQPCHHGRCVDQINGFICQCYQGYEGILCDVSRWHFLSVRSFEIDASRLSSMNVPIIHATTMVSVNPWSIRTNAIVHWVITVLIVSTRWKSSVPLIYVCEYRFCTQNLKSKTFSLTCRNNGTCIVTSDGQEQCTCLHGFTGSQCESKINACDTNPCHHGTCHEMSNGYYTCSCLPGYTGFNCQVDINECESVPCLHNGVCQESEVGEYRCVCPQGYAGEGF